MGTTLRVLAIALAAGVACVACGDDEGAAADAGRVDAATPRGGADGGGGVGGSGGRGEGGVGGDPYDAHGCSPSDACFACVEVTCCSTPDSCGGLVDASVNSGPLVPTPLYTCWLSCMEECVAGDYYPEAGGDPRECSRVCRTYGPGVFEVPENFKHYAAVFSCIEESLANGAGDDAGRADDDAGRVAPGCMAECFPSLFGDLDAGGT